MESLLTKITTAENELALVENIIQNILIYQLPEGILVANFKFANSKDYDKNLIGGLAATIQEFTGDLDEQYIKSINLDEVNLLFLTHDKFIVLFVVDTNYPDSQYNDALFSFRETFIACLNSQEYGRTLDGAAISAQTIYSFISEDFDVEIQIGPKVTIYPFKLRELAEKAAKHLLGQDKPSADLYDDTEIQEDIKSEKRSHLTSVDQLNKLLTKFMQSFSDVSQITLFRTTSEGQLKSYTQSNLEEEVQNNLYDTVMGMIDAVSTLLDQEQADRVIDLDERLIFFQKVSDFSFIYLVVDNKDSGELIWPIVERISQSISKSFPDEIDL